VERATKRKEIILFGKIQKNEESRQAGWNADINNKVIIY